MTSNLSSAKQFQTSFVQALKKYCFHGILLFALLLPFFSDIYSMYRKHEMYLSGMMEYSTIDRYVFALNRNVYTDEMGYVCLAVGLSAMFLALHCWRFLHVKKTLNVYFSLGITKSNLFLSRVAACAVHLLAPIVLIFAGLLVGNLLIFGSSPQLWTATCIYVLSLSAIALFAFFMTTLAMCVSGASVESFLCSGCLIAMPVTLFYGMKYLAAATLKGNAIEHWMHDVATGDTLHNGSFLPDFSYLDFFRPVTDFRFSEGFAWEKSAGWMHPGWEYPLLWLAVSVLLFVLCYVCFRYRKNENAGFLGKNPALIGVSCLSLAFLISVPVYLITEDEVAGNLVIYFGAPILLLVYTIIMAILLRSKKKLARAMPVALVVCAVFVLVSSIFLTGGFGYENRIPDKEDIESVSVSCGTYPYFADGNASFNEGAYGYYWTEDNELQKPTAEDFFLDQLSFYYGHSASLVCNLTDEKDIDTVLNVHRLMLEATDDELSVFTCPVALQYKLKDGSVMSRYYETATPEVMELLAVYETHDDVKRNYVNLFDDIWIENVNLIAPAAAQITLVPGHLFEDGFDQELRDAFVQDIKDGTFPICRFGPTAPIGYISLAGNMHGYDESYDYGYESYGEEYAYATTYAYVEWEAPYMAADVTEPMVLSINQVIDDYEYCDFQNVFPVFADMKNTIAVLTKYDLLQYYTATQQPVSAKLLRTPFVDKLTKGDFGRTVYYHSNLFRGSYLPADNDLSIPEIMPDNKFTQDAAVLAQLVKNSFLTYPVTQDGCMVAFEYADGTSVLTYVPIENVPENLR